MATSIFPKNCAVKLNYSSMSPYIPIETMSVLILFCNFHLQEGLCYISDDPIFHRRNLNMILIDNEIRTSLYAIIHETPLNPFALALNTNFNYGAWFANNWSMS